MQLFNIINVICVILLIILIISNTISYAKNYVRYKKSDSINDDLSLNGV
ncbi:hypothetical protein [Fusobacterium sp. PH5-44]